MLDLEFYFSSEDFCNFINTPLAPLKFNKPVRYHPSKINSTLRSEAIENKFIADLTKLNTIFNSSKEEKYKTGLNEHRELMLEQLQAQRDHELNQVNELKASPELNLQQLTDLYITS